MQFYLYLISHGSETRILNSSDYTAEQREILDPNSKAGLRAASGFAVVFQVVLY